MMTAVSISAHTGSYTHFIASSQHSCNRTRFILEFLITYRIISSMTLLVVAASPLLKDLRAPHSCLHSFLYPVGAGGISSPKETPSVWYLQRSTVHTFFFFGAAFALGSGYACSATICHSSLSSYNCRIGARSRFKAVKTAVFRSPG